MKEGKGSEAHMTVAKRGILDNGYGSNLLRNVTDRGWENSKVSRGVRVVFVREQKSWQLTEAHAGMNEARTQRENARI